MKHLILTCILLTGIVACSSHQEKSNAKAQEVTKAYDPVLDQDAQIARIKTMIQTNTKIDNEKKEQLVKLVDEQNVKVTEMRKKQSQLRAALIDQLLTSADGTNNSTMVITKQLEDLNKNNIKGLNDFILKFQSLSGERDAKQNDLMREAGSVNFL